MGTGDGLFPYHRASEQSETFFIGIDANARPLEKISEKIYRKPAKGGLSNLLFVQSAVEELSSDLDGIVQELYVNLPWGSLLAAVAGANDVALANLRHICAPAAIMRVTVALDPQRDANALQRLQLPALSLDYIDSNLLMIYRDAGFELVQRNVWTGEQRGELQTSWAKRLGANTKRQVVSIIARAV